MHSITIMTDGCTNSSIFGRGTEPNRKKIKEDVRTLADAGTRWCRDRYDKRPNRHYARTTTSRLKPLRWKLGFVTRADFDRIVDPAKMSTPTSHRPVATLGVKSKSSG